MPPVSFPATNEVLDATERLPNGATLILRQGNTKARHAFRHRIRE